MLVLLAAGCKLLLGDPDRIIALEIVGPTSYTVSAGDTLHLRARARAANGDTVVGALIQWAVLDTGTVRIALDPAIGIIVPESVGTWRVQASVEDIRSDPIEITVQPAAAASLSIAGLGDPITAGTAASVTATALDAFGNLATGYTGTVHFTSTDGAATVPTDYTFTPGAAGAHTFAGGVTLRTAGQQTVTATDLADATITGSQPGIAVQPGAAASLMVAGIPDPIVAGTAASVTVTAHDAFANVATGYTGSVQFTSTDNAATLPVDYTFTGGDAGVHLFTSAVTLRTAGEQSVTARDLANGTITGSHSAITVTAQTGAAVRGPGSGSIRSVLGSRTPDLGSRAP